MRIHLVLKNGASYDVDSPKAEQLIQALESYVKNPTATNRLFKLFTGPGTTLRFAIDLDQVALVQETN